MYDGLLDKRWLYSTIECGDFKSMVGFYFLVFMSITYVILYMLVLSDTVFLGIFLLLGLFLVNIMLLYLLHQYLFALFLLSIYVGAILVFFTFVVMSFIFFGKTYIMMYRLWILHSIYPVLLVCLGYVYVCSFSISLFVSYSVNHYGTLYSMFSYDFDELKIIGLLLFDYDMMYVILVVSLMLFIGLLGSITFNASSLVKTSSSFYNEVFIKH